ncbi:antitoxin protein of toxin-antitoxin system [Knoellia remsis]|uniref:Antitoxin protein of toxin-antitoxin system n=1 Tax=Knoellia remsis TaxID=407159 RepID=A0A2T0V0I4_9MICO|nr:antitoxin [Knoellia remsis]PRY63666.1 antitoxin protein of toxin-antitoxin system [Knoellia remsis]
MSMFDKAKDLAAENSDKVEQFSDQGLDKAGEFAESKGLGADQVQQGRDFVDGRIGNDGEAGAEGAAADGTQGAEGEQA